MANLEDLGELISTDMLIVGGSIGGLCAALRAKEESPEINILVVDKQSVGWAGAARGEVWLSGHCHLKIV